MPPFSRIPRLGIYPDTEKLDMKSTENLPEQS
jgi:hypothetical protein